MLWADFHQQLNPLNNRLLSTVFAALPVVVLIWLLVPRRWPAPRAGAAAAGAGTPVAICGAIMVGLGFDPFLAAVLCLIANTSPVAYGGLGTPLIVLNGVTDLPTETLSVMAGHQLPILSLIVPLYMVRCMCSWKQTLAVWPVLLVAGGSFAAFQFTFATMHVYAPGVVLWPMTDIGGGMFSLIATAIFLRFWKPREQFQFAPEQQSTPGATAQHAADDPHAAAAKALVQD